MRAREAAAAVVFAAAGSLACSSGDAREIPESPSVIATPRTPGDLQRGFVLGLFARDEGRFADRGLGEIRGLGSNAVSISIPWVTHDSRSVRIGPRGDMTPTDASLRHAIREAHRLGMSVFLLPIVYVDVAEAGQWRGTLEPAEWGAWFSSYSRMILHYADLARQEGVEYLSVGSELGSSEDRRQDWLDLISKVRRLYGGALTYSANWDHYESVSFLDALDYAGVNAYFDLSPDPDASVSSLREAWGEIIRKLDAWRGRAGKPLILTEAGFPSRRGAIRDPWNYAADGPVDLGSQERSYRAFAEAWTGHPGLSGVYFYLWWGRGGPEDAGYTPRGKPAAQVVADWFGRLGTARVP